VLTDIARLEQANAMMRTANQALARDDVVALVALGFSHQHIEELKQKGGFRSSSLAQNTRMITNLRKVGGANAQ
jgi:Holliday junction resolvasome RuvABC DNA-binding subunit